MNRFVWILLLLSFTNCNQSGKTERSELNKTTSSSEFQEPSFSMEIGQDLNLPPGFSLDTIQMVDQKRNLQFRLVLPVSAYIKLNKIVADSVNREKNEFLAYIDEVFGRENVLADPHDPIHEFYVTPISVYEDENLVSYAFLISDNVGGAPHPSASFKSFNFNLKDGSLFQLNNYFKIDSKRDSSFLINSINKAMPIEGIKIHTLENFDFNIEGDTVSVNFSESEIAPYGAGLIRARLPKKPISEKIRLK